MLKKELLTKQSELEFIPQKARSRKHVNCIGSKIKGCIVCQEHSEFFYSSRPCEIQIINLKFVGINTYVLLYFQLVRLDNLFAYWNVKSEMFYHGGCDESLVSKA